MKKILILIIAGLLSFSIKSFSQDMEVGGSIGYMMSGGLNLIEGDADITNNISYGGFTHFIVTDDVAVEILYLRKDTKVNYSNFLLNIKDSYGLSVEYYHVGGVKTFGESDIIRPFASFSMGLTRYHLKEKVGIVSYDDAFRYSIAPSLGLKYYLSDRLGLKVQARLLMPLSFNGYGLYWSTSGGTSTAFSLTVPVWQGDFSGGIFLRL
jgi:hypothetical protein